MRTHPVRSCAALAASLCLHAAAGPALAAPTPPSYSLVGTYAAPSGAWDVRGDGRLISIDASGAVLVQDAANASTYTTVGSVPGGLLNGGASFVSLSPDGSLLAFGDNNFGAGSGASVYVIETSSLSTGGASPVFGIEAANFGAAWSDDSTLFVSGSESFGAPSHVTRIDTTSLASLTADVAIANVGGASGGVAIAGGHLLTGNGFDNGPGGSETGTIRAFDLASLTGPALDFEIDGLLVGRTLSASPLDVDHQGNLLVGGGDFSEGDTGYAGVVAADAIADALAGLGAYDASSVAALSPNGPFDFYAARANHATQEVLVTYFGDPSVYRYAIPAPGAIGVLGLASLAGLRRRRGA